MSAADGPDIAGQWGVWSEMTLTRGTGRRPRGGHLAARMPSAEPSPRGPPNSTSWMRGALSQTHPVTRRQSTPGLGSADLAWVVHGPGTPGPVRCLRRSHLCFHQLCFLVGLKAQAGRPDSYLALTLSKALSLCPLSWKGR